MVQEQVTKSHRLLRRPKVQEKSGLSRSAIYERMDPESPYYDPDFPLPVRLGDGKNPPVAWVESELDAWIEKRIELTRAAERPTAEQPNLPARLERLKNASSAGKVGAQ